MQVQKSGSVLHVTQLLQRLRLEWLLQHLPPRFVWAVYVFLNGFFTIGTLALLGAVSRSPFVFPSLGPTAYLFFFSPLAEAASPRNTIAGHAIGLVCGFAAFLLFPVPHLSYAATQSIYWPRIFAAALSLSLTGALMVLFRISHPPAGATTLIVALGILSRPKYLLVIEIAVILLTSPGFSDQSPCRVAVSTVAPCRTNWGGLVLLGRILGSNRAGPARPLITNEECC
ncbi:MAG: HPP family protein [Janthinobacterium lividum]